MIRGNPQQAHELTVSISDRTARLGNAKGIDTGNTLRQRHGRRGNRLPFQASVSVDLRPGQLADFFKSVEDANFLVLFKREPALEKRGII